MKVCFVAANHPPEALGGTEQVLVALARELRARGCDVEDVCGSDLPHDGVDVAAEEFGGVRVHRVRRLPEERDRFRFVWPRLQAVVRGAVERIRPDVVHVHGFGALGLGLVPQLRGLRLPVALTFHDLWATCARYFRVPVVGVVCPTGADREPCVRCIAADAAADPAAVREALARRDQRLQAEVAAASVLIAPSATAARFVRDCLPCERPIEVVPHGLLRPTPASERAAAPQPGERLRIGTFGGLVAEKGVLELLAAARGLPCELHLSGRVYDDAIAARLAAARADGVDVRVHGPYTAADPHPARRLHLAVFPSKCQETYGLVVDEALAHGVPVVCSDAGALAERRGTGGVVVAPIADLPATLRGLVTSPDRLAALRAAIPSALPTIAASADRHLALYRSLR